MKSEAVFALEHAGWPALLVDDGSTILRANQAAVKLFGPALEGASPLLSAIWSPENGVTAEQFLARWERSPTTTVALKFRVKGGGMTSHLVAICAHARDQQRLFVLQLLPDATGADVRNTGGETTFFQRQKLDCALQLARTVALDLNNALTSVLGHTSLLLSQAEPDHPWRNSLVEVEKSVARAAEVASDLADFSRQEREPRAQIAGNVNALLQRCVETFQCTGAAHVAWKFDLDRRLYSARFDEAKVQQAFVKVLENAVEAVREDGRVSLQTRNVELTGPTQDRGARLAPGAYVCVTISDNGLGIGPEVMPRIFEPFFTTKGGAHRGLGLAWVYGIITNHGGGVAVSSQRGAGTAVRIYLPAEKRVAPPASGISRDLHGHETILMVDDEDLLLTMGETILRAYGYRVLTANSGQKALEILTGGAAPVDLMITDLVMPAMNGRELVERVRRLAPGTRVLCTSGYVWPAQQPANAAYLRKPFTSQELLVRVKHVLETPLMGVDAGPEL